MVARPITWVSDRVESGGGICSRQVPCGVCQSVWEDESARGIGGSVHWHMRHGAVCPGGPLACLGTAHCGQIISASISSWVGVVFDVMRWLRVVLELPSPDLSRLPVGSGTLFSLCRMRYLCESSCMRAMIVGASVSGSSGW